MDVQKILQNKKEYRENFDYVVSRAVANLTVLSEYCIPYVKKKGDIFFHINQGISKKKPRIQKSGEKI